jgi:hypothetical protein
LEKNNNRLEKFEFVDEVAEHIDDHQRRKNLAALLVAASVELGRKNKYTEEQPLMKNDVDAYFGL